MIIHPDFKEFLQLLENHNVEYMIVGGYAVAFHGYVRNTKDIDIFYNLSPANISRIISALLEFGFSPEEVDPSNFSLGNIISFGVPPLRVDLLNSIDGISFETATVNAIVSTYDGALARFVSREDLITNKKSTQRLRDRVDVEELEN